MKFMIVGVAALLLGACTANNPLAMGDALCKDNGGLLAMLWVKDKGYVYLCSDQTAFDEQGNTIE